MSERKPKWPKRIAVWHYDDGSMRAGSAMDYKVAENDFQRVYQLVPLKKKPRARRKRGRK